jgi:tetratricopeptide (TPR) repeat protein
MNPMHSRAFYNRAFCHDRVQAYQKALADYSAALAIEPSPTAYHNRGTVFEQLGKEKEALQDYAAAILAEPSGSALSRHAR